MPSAKKKFYLAYRIVTISASILGVAYILLLAFPQPLFAHATKYQAFQIYSRQPITPELTSVLDSAEERLKRSPLYDSSTPRYVYLTDSFGIYTLLSHKAYKSFAHSVPFIDNVIVNKSDVGADRVFVNREFSNSRSLSGVIAHETAHLFIRRKYGTVSASLLPTWKNEGYCEYVAGESTITVEEGIRRWRENTSDDMSYRYIKYHLMVKHLLENEGMSVDDLFSQSLDEAAVAERTYAALVAN